MRPATRVWMPLGLGMLALLSLSGWRSSADLVQAPEFAPRGRVSTELEVREQKQVISSQEDVAISSWPALGGGLIVLMSIGMVQNARSRNRAQSARRRLPNSGRPGASLPHGDSPEPDELELLIRELDELALSFRDAA